MTFPLLTVAVVLALAPATHAAATVVEGGGSCAVAGTCPTPELGDALLQRTAAKGKTSESLLSEQADAPAANAAEEAKPADVAKATCPVLTPSGAVSVTAHNQVIENLDINTTNADAAGISCKGFDNVVIRNVRITHQVHPGGKSFHATSQGISFVSCNQIKITNVRVQLIGHDSGPLPTFKDFNIYGTTSKDVVITDVILSGGSSGLWVKECENLKFSNWAVYNVHGPFPRGQCVQLDMCTGGVIENFVCKNQLEYSWPEDCISMWRSANSTVRNGVILGSNSVTGASIMFEQSMKLDNSWGLAENVYAAETGSGYFAYGGTNIVFKNVAIKDNHCVGTGGRKKPASGGLLFYAGYEMGCGCDNVSIDKGFYSNGCKKTLLWQAKENPKAWVQKDLTDKDMPQASYQPKGVELCFSIGGTKYTASSTTESNVGLFGDGSVAYGSALAKDSKGKGSKPKAKVKVGKGKGRKPKAKVNFTW